MARVWVEQEPVAQAAFNASVMSESSDSSDSSSEPCMQCGSRCGGLWFCRRTPLHVKQRRLWKQWSRSHDQQPLWHFLCFLAHEIPALYNVIRQDLIRFSGRPQPLRNLDATPSQGDSEDRMLRDAEDWAAERRRELDRWTAERAALNSSDPSVHPDQIDEEVILRLGH